MRIGLVVALVGIAAAPNSATAAHPLREVVRYECAHLSDGPSEMACSFGDSGLRFEWEKNPNELPQEIREVSRYRSSKLVANYFVAGGNSFEIRGPHFIDDRYKDCRKISGERFRFICHLCDEVMTEDGIATCERVNQD